MKALLAVVGVGVFGAAVFFIVRGRSLPNTGSTQASGNVGKPKSGSQIASSLLTSQNIATIGGIFDKLGGSATVAPKGGAGESGFVTSY